MRPLNNLKQTHLSNVSTLFCAEIVSISLVSGLTLNSWKHFQKTSGRWSCISISESDELLRPPISPLLRIRHSSMLYSLTFEPNCLKTKQRNVDAKNDMTNDGSPVVL